MRAVPRLLLLLLLLPLPAWAGAPPAPSPSLLCDLAIAAAERHANLPPRLLNAVAEVESGRPDPATGTVRPWPWTINAEGEGRFFPNQAAAVAAVRALQAQGVTSIDVGCLQVNLLFHPDAFAAIEQAFDPFRNAAYAARFLVALHAGTASWLPAIAAYHSMAPALGTPYRQRVVAVWERPDFAFAGVVPHAPYRDFAPISAVYGAFQPAEQVYGAFAPPPSGYQPGAAAGRRPNGALAGR